MKSINAIMRPASTTCNLSCDYCSNKLEQSYRSSHIMKIDTLKRIINNLTQGECSMIKFLWHGGEPMLAGIDYYQQAVEFQKFFMNRFTHQIEITNTMQTNGLLLNDEKIKFFIKEGFNFGVSIDGPAYIHNLNRQTIFGDGSHSASLKAAKRIIDVGERCGIVSVVTKKSLPYAEKIFEFFIANGFTNIHFSPYAEINRDEAKMNKESITASEFGEFIVRVFLLWKALDNPKIKVRIIDNFLQGLLGGKMELCSFAKNCGHHMLIEYDGSAFICGRNANNENFYIGNIADVSLNKILDSERFHRITSQMHSVARSCNSGCSYYKMLFSYNLQSQTEYFCEGYKIILAELENWLHKENINLI